MRLVFMGTPDIARDALETLLESGLDVVGVYTRADKPVGRKQVLTPPPVKVLAQQKGLPVFQPKTLRTADAAAQLAQLKPDLVVVVAYGLILPQAVLEVPRHGCINLHVSLLPKYRGAAPIQWAVINGETETGVTIMQMDEGLDSGPVLACERFAIGPDETAGEVFDKATSVGAALLAATIGEIAAGKVQPVPQPEGATLAPRLDKVMAEMDFARPAAELHNLVRGCNPWPLAWFGAGGKKIKVEKTALAENAQAAPQGTVLCTKPLTVACGDGALALLQVKPEGSRSMTGAEWAAGRRFNEGDALQPG